MTEKKNTKIITDLPPCAGCSGCDGLSEEEKWEQMWREIHERSRKEAQGKEPRYYYSHDTLWDGDPEGE
jgi:hypothetical protein